MGCSVVFQWRCRWYAATASLCCQVQLPFRSRSRLSLSDKIYERELQLALEISRSESSQEEGKSHDHETVGVDGSDNEKENMDCLKSVVPENDASMHGTEKEIDGKRNAEKL